jgi:Peptidase family M28
MARASRDVTGTGDLDALAREAIGHLASFERPSASDGERRAADWIAAKLREEGVDAHVEEERAHGTYWWPLGLLTAASGLAALTGRRRIAAAVGAASAVLIADDISGGKQVFRRRALPGRATWNVVGEGGDVTAARTVVLVAHHDAAHWSLLFSPAVPAWIGEHFPDAIERSDETPPVMFPVIGGPLLVLLAGLTGSRRLRRAGALLSLGSAATMAEIGSRSTVPGANDNLSGVAVLLGVARRLRDQPVEGLRVLFVSTGSEESFMEGMQAFARRHFASFPTNRTHFICVDTVGSPKLMQLEGEGMLRMRDYPESFKALVSAVAADAGIHLARGMHFRNATDGLIALKRGYPTVMLGSYNRYKVPSNYHWPTDTAENVEYDTVVDAIRLCDGVVRRLAGRAA